MRNSVIRIILFSVIVLTGQMKAYAEQDVDSNSSAGVTDSRKNYNWLHMEALMNAMNAAHDQLAELGMKIYASENEIERTKLTQEAERLALDISVLQTAWELQATGGVDLDLFSTEVEKEFNWRDELQSVFEPILLEMKKLTERPRKIERLRTEQDYYQQRKKAAESALGSVVEYRKNAPSPQLQSALVSLEQNWRKRYDTLNNRLNLIDLELQKVFAPTPGEQHDAFAAIKELLSGRILNLLIALIVMGFMYLLLRTLSRLYNRFITHKNRKQHTLIVRLGSLVYYLFTIFTVLLSGMVVLYMSGDWMLMGLFIILLVGATWAIQRSLPNYLMEAKLFLNLGAVREGERIIYNDLPWQVKKLNFYSVLVNPLLESGTLRVPLKELTGYISRKFDSEEPWFPTRTEDYLLLDDGSYGQVITQTPESVQLKVLGSIKTYRTTNYLELNPRNLSLQGFTLLMTFGLDYQHQEKITTRICEAMEKALSEGISRAELNQQLTQLSVEFKQAAASSLDLIAITTFNGDAAVNYFSIQRLLQRLAVDACNQHGWVIPFNQITVHTA